MKVKHPNRIHVFNDDALGTDDAVSLALKLKSGDLSANELAAAARKRALKLNPKLHCVAFNAPSHVLANKKHHQAFFYGLPTYLKDNVALKGLPTGFGSAACHPKKETRHGLYTRQFLSSGVTVLGKSTLPEFGLNASTEPSHRKPTPNPWNLSHSAGASSGGAAALVSSGVVPFAHGNDGGGSIRIPAACCGLVGLKPSRNRHINDKAARSLPINIVSEGILSRSVRDTAYFHYTLQKYYQNKKLPPLPLVTTPGSKRLKIAYYLDSVTGFSTDTATRAAVEQTLILLDNLGHHVEEIRFPVSAQFGDDFAMYWGMLAYMLAKTAKLTIKGKFNPHNLDGLSKGLAKHYKKNIFSTPFFLARLKKHAQQFRMNFSEYDVLVSPVIGQVPRPLGELHPDIEFEVLLERLSRYAAFTPMANISGTPALSLPLGFSDAKEGEQGLPIGVQFGADIGREQTLLELAYELEGAAPWQHLYQV